MNTGIYNSEGYEINEEELDGKSVRLVAAWNTEDKDVLWHFISRYVPEANPENAPMLDKLTENAVNYFKDFIKPNKIIECKIENKILTKSISLHCRIDTQKELEYFNSIAENLS